MQGKINSIWAGLHIAAVGLTVQIEQGMQTRLFDTVLQTAA